MAKQKSSKSKGLRDLKRLPEDPYVPLDDGFSERTNLLDHSSEIGSYEVDGVAIDLLRLGQILTDKNRDEVVEEARIVADLGGAHAARSARQELQRPSQITECRRLFDCLVQIRRLTGQVCKIEPDGVGTVLVRRGPDDDDYGDDEIRAAKRRARDDQFSTERLLSTLSEADRELAAYLAKYEAPAQQGSSKDPLTGWFIWYVALGWKGLTGAWVRSSDTVGFRRFLVAAWNDLGFPDPVDRNGRPKPLEDHFRDRVAKSDIFEHFRGN